MSTHRASASAGTTDISLEEKKVHYLLDRCDRISMLGEAHRPAANDSITLHGDFRGFSNLLAGQPAAFLNFCPLGPTQFFKERLVSRRNIFR